jgi:chromosomal replication initiator protein
MGLVEQALEQVQAAQNRSAPEMEDLIMAVAGFYAVRPQDLCGRDRSRDVSTARQVAMYIAREEADIPLQQIGEALGGRNHSTVLYSCERIAELMQTDSLVRRQIRAIGHILHPQSVPAQNPELD